MLEMIPRLQAEDRLHGMSVVAAGSGVLKREDQRSLVADWRRAARAPHSTASRLTREERASMAAAVGIHVEG